MSATAVNTGTAVTIGTFDGLHLGHRHLLATLCAAAAARGLEPLAVTFARHPLATLRPGAEPPLLAPRPPRLPVRTEVIDFDRATAALTAADFMTLLRERYDARLLVIGHDNRLGSDLPADLGRYAAIGRGLGLEVIAASPWALPDGRVPASSAIRRALLAGDPAGAADMLGRPYALGGVTVPGRQNGRRLGFPTLNLRPAAGVLVPAAGVYAGTVTLAGDSRALPAVINVGDNPTIAAGNPVTVEAHVIDTELDPDLYGRKATFTICRYLRGERRFGSLDELRAAIGADVTACRSWSDASHNQ